MAVPGLVRCSSLIPAVRWSRARLRSGCFALLRELRQAKIQNLGMAALGDENISWLDVAVNDTFRVRGVQCVGDLDAAN